MLLKGSEIPYDELAFITNAPECMVLPESKGPKDKEMLRAAQPLTAKGFHTFPICPDSVLRVEADAEHISSVPAEWSPLAS